MVSLNDLVLDLFFLVRFAEANSSEVERDQFVEELSRELSKVDTQKPQLVARLLGAVLPRHLAATLHLSPATHVRMARATIHEPGGGSESDNAMKFTANLVLGVHLDCEIRDVVDMNHVRIKVREGLRRGSGSVVWWYYTRRRTWRSRVRSYP
jgi:hypothetical protein